MSNLVKRNLFWPSTSSVDEFLNENFFNLAGMAGKTGNLPRVNITETDDDFKVEMAAPGMRKEDFHVELDNDNLVIWTERSSSEENTESNYHRREFSYEAFRRSFYLPNTVEAEKINARYENGLLLLVIPKKEEARKKPAKKIKIT